VLRRAARRLTQFYDEMLAPTNLRISQFSLLALVYELSAPIMNGMAELIRALIDRLRIDPSLIEDVLMGCVYPEGPQGNNVARIALLRRTGYRHGTRSRLIRWGRIGPVHCPS
jgi:hypothetical protein